MTHQLHRGGHVIIALRLLRQTGSLDQLLPISHPLWSKAVGSHRGSVVSQQNTLVVRDRARAPVSTQARAKSGAAAHVRLERRAKG